ncbi:hypothetical protein PoB_003117100 [Plakobranchus ocellatus]|uniref:Uncharacterized protein n=1 Tax=Plakobranchus ocellatus TaxID=259542 RepID=A0AAV4ADD8_9GAST|nr:hypothetical protein PoB_003117100 [Plakobranchus ocellatus]
MTFNLLLQLTKRSTNKEDEDEGSPVDDVGVETDDESDVNFDVEEGEGDGLRLDSSDDDGSEFKLLLWISYNNNNNNNSNNNNNKNNNNNNSNKNNYNNNNKNNNNNNNNNNHNSSHLYVCSDQQQGDLRLSDPPSSQGAGGSARTNDIRFPADFRRICYPLHCQQPQKQTNKFKEREFMLRATEIRPGYKTQRIAPTLRQVTDLMCAGTKERDYLKTCSVGHVNCCLQCAPTLSLTLCVTILASWFLYPSER